MKKIFTLIIACIATVSAMAQMHGAMNFIGNSEFYLPAMKEQTLTKTVKDAVQVTMNANDQSITIPDMVYTQMGMTIKSFTISGLTYTMTGSYPTGDMAFEWNADNFTTTTTGTDGKEKTITGSALKAKYTHATGELTLEITFTYGTMKMPLTYSIDGFYTADNAWGLAGRGTVGNPYRIFDAADFTAMASNYNTENTGKDEFFLVMNDINFGGSAENPVQLPAIAKDGNAQIANISGGFKGTFDGGNHTISGIYHTNNGNNAEGKYNGLFGFVDKEGVIKNVIFGKDNYVNGYNYVGSIVSINQGTIENCINNADITASNFAAAGICGFMAKGNGTVKDCQNYGNIKAMTYAAGICGGTQSGSAVTEYNYLIENCTNNGDLSTTNGTGSAGIAGSYSGSIKGCTNNGNADDKKGTAKNKQNTAGIVATMSYAVALEDCTNNGNINGVNNVAGIVGNVMLGDSKAFTVKNCINNGTVSSIGVNVAGIIGNSGREDGVVSVAGCTNNGEVSTTAETNSIGNLRGAAKVKQEADNTIAAGLTALYLDDANITAVKNINADNATIANGTYVKNGAIVIVKNGKTYNVAGIEQ